MKEDPIALFREWFDEALAAGVEVPEAMTLATADADGRPSARMLLLKSADDSGFTFFTGYESRKGLELAENPRAALVFYWAVLDRQVRIEGTVEKTSREESAAYFESRPRGSRLGAWASPQSRPVDGRQEIERLLEEAAGRFAEGDVPVPDFWGGFRVRHEAVEFWQGRTNRLHDRLRYARVPEGGWRIERLAP